MRNLTSTPPQTKPKPWKMIKKYAANLIFKKKLSDVAKPAVNLLAGQGARPKPAVNFIVEKDARPNSPVNVTIEQGDITLETTQAIVNSTTDNMSMGRKS